jgi:hypothetical protein
MSYQASDWAVAQPVGNASAKLVLLILAHHRNPLTGRCFPSVATIASETGLSDRGVRLAIARLAKLGLIELRGSTTRRHYHLNVTAPAPGADVSRETPALDAAGNVPAPAYAAAIPAQGAGNSGTPCRLTSKEHVNNREGENAPAPDDADGRGKTKTPVRSSAHANRYRAATRLPADWQPSQDGIAFAKREHPGVDWQREARAFRDYWLAKPDGASVDWEASWRRWLDRVQQFAPRQKREEAYRPKYDRLPPGEPWLLRVPEFKERGFWFREWGAPPGSESGCRVPAYVLRQFGYPVYERGVLVPPSGESGDAVATARPDAP